MAARSGDPPSATVRLYAELNDFVAPARRQRDLRVRFTVGPTVKDAIEGLGVPHTEVALVVVDGAPVGFDHRLVGGDRVSAYPAFTGIGLPPELDLQPASHPQLRFLADVHLATLARHLRLLGFDTRLASHDEPDALLAEVAATEQRVVLTRDRGLLKRRVVTHGCYVRSSDPQAQLDEVAARCSLASSMAPFTRCMACNGVLEEVDVTDIAERLPPGTRRAGHDDFRRCVRCTRVFWPGAHHTRLVHVVERVRRVAR